jgi:hypothetical protein
MVDRGAPFGVAFSEQVRRAYGTLPTMSEIAI